MNYPPPREFLWMMTKVGNEAELKKETLFFLSYPSFSLFSSLFLRFANVHIQTGGNKRRSWRKFDAVVVFFFKTVNISDIWLCFSICIPGKMCLQISSSGFLDLLQKLLPWNLNMTVISGLVQVGLSILDKWKHYFCFKL